MHASEGQNSRWEAFTKFGAATATEMTGKNFDKWLKDAGVLDSKNITSTMTGIAFSKVAGYVPPLLHFYSIDIDIFHFRFKLDVFGIKATTSEVQIDTL